MMTMDEAKKSMKAAIDHFSDELKNIRTGRANPAMVEGLTVEVYGSPMRLLDVAGISVPEPMQILITPYDRSNSAAIGKSIIEANLGFNPIVEAHCVRINIPPMDGTVRAKMIKRVGELCESAKVRIRQVRKEANDYIKGNKEFTEDDKKRLEKDVQEMTDKNCKIADDVAKKKEGEISTI